VAGDIPELPPPPGGTAGIASARFDSQHRRALWVVGFLSVTSIAILLAIMSTAHQIGLLSRVHAGGIVTLSEAEASDARQLVTTLGHAGLIVVTAVVWMTSSSAGSEPAWTHSARLAAGSFSTSSCCPTSSEPTGSASSWSYPESRAFAELLIDCEEDRALRAVLVGMLWEADRPR